MNRPATSVVLLLLGLLAGGCASFDAQVEHGRSLAGISRFFIVSNASDNHALDHHLAGVLKARGYTAEVGPLTMLPENTQAVVTYESNWSWDFGEHLSFLRITVRDPQSQQSFATVTFSARVPLRDTTPEIVDRLVDKLLPPKP